MPAVHETPLLLTALGRSVIDNGLDHRRRALEIDFELLEGETRIIPYVRNPGSSLPAGITEDLVCLPLNGRGHHPLPFRQGVSHLVP